MTATSEILRPTPHRGGDGGASPARARVLEAVYQEALAIELSERGVAFQREVEIPIHYRGRQLACSYRADFVCYGEVLVELKALKHVTDVERAQVINYLKTTGLQRALLLNFGAASLEHKRIVRQFTPSA